MSLVLLSVLLEQQTELHPTDIMTDSGAYSDVIFGLFRLLGYRFMPRLADLGSLRLWRIDRTADYGLLNSLARHRVSLRPLVRHWEDMLRLAGSLKLAGVVHADPSSGERPTKLAQAVAALGRIEKTLHILTYIDEEAVRRRVLLQLNRHEDRHKLARTVSMVGGGSCANATAKGKKTSWGPWDWSST